MVVGAFSPPPCVTADSVISIRRFSFRGGSQYFLLRTLKNLWNLEVSALRDKRLSFSLLLADPPRGGIRKGDLLGRRIEFLQIQLTEPEF